MSIEPEGVYAWPAYVPSNGLDRLSDHLDVAQKRRCPTTRADADARFPVFAANRRRGVRRGAGDTRFGCALPCAPTSRRRDQRSTTRGHPGPQPPNIHTQHQGQIESLFAPLDPRPVPVHNNPLPRMEPISTRVNVYTTTKPGQRERPARPCG